MVRTIPSPRGQPHQRGFLEGSTPDLKFLDEGDDLPEESNQKKRKLIKLPSLKNLTSPGRKKKDHEHDAAEQELDLIIRKETARRNQAFTEATLLYYNIVRSKGWVRHVSFEHEGDLGFTLALSRDGVDGRSVMTVDSVNAMCEHRNDVKVGDELVMIYDCLIIQPSRDDQCRNQV